MHSRWKPWICPDTPEIDALPEPRGAVRVELVLVFAVTLGLSGLRSLLSLVDSLLAPVALDRQQVAINVPQASRSLLDLLGQLAGVLQLAAWGGLGLYLLYRAGLRPARIGLDRTRPGRDSLGAAGLAALIGIPGLALYFLARALHLNLTVAPSILAEHWWTVPVLVLQAVANAWAEEVLVVGYLISRLRMLGVRENRSLLAAAVLRGSYHLYQGFGGFVGNLLMGLIFGRVWQRTGRLVPLVLAHSILDIVAFVGYALLAPHLSWL